MPTVATQQTKFIVRHVGIHVIVVNVFQIGIILFEQKQQVRVVAYQMFRYPRVRLTEIEAVNVRVAAHRKVFSHRILLVAYYVIQDKNRIWARLVRWTTSLLLENEKYTISSIDVNKFSRYQCFGCCSDFE